MLNFLAKLYFKYSHRDENLELKVLEWQPVSQWPLKEEMFINRISLDEIVKIS